MTEAASTGNGNGSKALQSLKDINVPTLLLILATGGTNFLATRDNGAQLQVQRERVFQQVQELHAGLRDFEKRQQQSLENQNVMMRSDAEQLSEIHQILLRFEQWKQNEQRRKMPE